MKNLIQCTTAIFLLVQTIGFSQTEDTETISRKKDTTINKQKTKTEIDTRNDEYFIGTFLLKEAGFELEIAKEDGKMYIITEFSKDILLQKNKTTLHEITRGVDLELIKDNPNALKFTQNGYETTIKRVNAKTEK